MIASTGAVALLPAYPNNLLPWSVTSRPLKGEPPTVDLGEDGVSLLVIVALKSPPCRRRRHRRFGRVRANRDADGLDFEPHDAGARRSGTEAALVASRSIACARTRRARINFDGKIAARAGRRQSPKRKDAAACRSHSACPSRLTTRRATSGQSQPAGRVTTHPAAPSR
jgi:hypothetical protein